MISLYWRLSRRYLTGKKGRSLMTFLGITLGVTMVVAVLLMNDAILTSYEGLLSSAAGRADLQISATSGAGFPAVLLEEASRVQGLGAVVPVVTSSAPVIAGERQAGSTFYGIVPEKDRLVRDYKLTEGRLPERAGETAVSTDLAQALGLAAGAKLKVLTTEGMKEFAVSGIFDSKGTVRGSLGPFGVMLLADAQKAFGKAGKLDLIDLTLSPGVDAERVKEALQSSLGATVRVGAPAERSKDMQKILDGMLFVLTMAGSVSLFAGAFIIYTNVSMSVAERRRDLAILRALGLRKAEILRLVLSEAGLLGLLGSGLGLFLGYGMAVAMTEQATAQFLVSYGVQAADVTLTPSAVATAYAVGILAAMAAALAPARETLGFSPVEAMRPGDVGADRAGRFQWAPAAGGLAMIGFCAVFVRATWPEEGMLPDLMLRLWGLSLTIAMLGAVLLLPQLLILVTRVLLRPVLTMVAGMPGRLAAENFVRQPRRSAATVSSLMVSLMFMVGIGGVAASQTGTFDRWYGKVVAWDLNVATSFTGIGALVEVSPEFEAELARVDGVRLVSPQKMTRVILTDGEQAFLQVFDHKLLRQYSEMDMEEGDWNTAVDQMEQGGHALLSPAAARRLNVHRGDRFTLPTPSGSQTFTVAGIMTDITPYGGTVQIDRRDYLTYFGDQTSTNMAVLVQPGTDPETVRQRILDHFGDSMHLQVRLNREFWSEIRAQYDAFYQLLDALTAISLMISGLAIANTLFAAILERRREVGVLRAVGTRRGEIIRMVVGEAFGTGVVGGLTGLIGGLILQSVMVNSTEFTSGFSSDMVINWGSIGLACGIALVLAPAVGLLPARWASRLDVVDALRYE